MKQIKELRFEELTTEQKLGMIQTVYIRGDYSDGNKEYIYDLIRNRKLGSIPSLLNGREIKNCDYGGRKL